MKHKLAIALITVLMALFCVFGITSCTTGHNHSLEYVQAVPETCTTDGNVEYWHCSLCDRVFSDSEGQLEIYDTVIPAGHLWETEWTIDIIPTEQNDGEKSYHCSRCDARTEITLLSNTSGFYFQLNEDKQSYSCVGMQGNFNERNITIPEIYNGLPVTRIGSNAFSDKTIFDVTFPDTIKIIDDGAFSDSTIFSVIFGENSNLETIGYEAFFRCSFLKSVILPKNLSTMGADAFSYCGDIVFYSLAEQDVGDDAPLWHKDDYWHYSTNTEIYWGCVFDALVQEEGLEYLIQDDHAILTRCNTSEKTVYIPHSITKNKKEYPITKAGNLAFEGYDGFGTNNPLIIYCENQAADVQWLDAQYTTYYEVTDKNFVSTEDMHFVLTSQGVVVSRYIGSSEIVSVPKEVWIDGKSYQVKEIGDEAFKCSYVQEIKLPDGITRIGSQAFAAWYEPLKEVNLPDSLTYIGQNTGIASADMQFTNGIMHLSGWILDCDNDSTSININFPIKGIAEYAFSSCTDVETIVFSADTNLQYVCDYAFQNCSGLTEIVFPDTVVRMGYGILSDSTKLNSITIPFVGATKDDPINNYLGYIFESETPNYMYNLRRIDILGGTVLTTKAFYRQYRPDGNNGIAEIKIPASINLIEAGCLPISSNLSKIEYSGNINGWCAIQGLQELVEANVPIYVNGIELKGEIVIPKEVAIIESYAFKGLDITSVVFENNSNLQSIKEYAFADCVNLQGELYIPTTVQEIEQYAFYGCTKLTAVLFENNNNLEVIAPYTFANCVNLYTLTLGSGIAEIGEKAFCGCTALSGILNIPYSVEKIGVSAFEECVSISGLRFETDSQLSSVENRAFLGCDSLGGIIKMPDSVEVIGDYAFYECSNIQSVQYGENSQLRSIGSLAFASAISMNYIQIPASLTNIGVAAFPIETKIKNYYYDGDISGWLNLNVEYNTSYGIWLAENLYIGGQLLTNLIIPSHVQEIRDNAFCSNANLKSVAFEEGSACHAIGDYAFQKCILLETVTLPISIQTIGNSAFSMCTSLSDIYYQGSVASWCGISGLETLMRSYGTVYVDGETLTGDIVLPDTVTSIGDYAFSACREITSISIPNSVTSIGDWAFADCTGLKEIIIPDSVMYIGERAFSNCSTLTLLQDGVYYVDRWVVGYDSSIDSLESVTLRSDTAGIGGNAFSFCTTLKEIVIPNSVKNIGERAFEECTALKSVTIGSGVQSISRFAFLNCLELEEIIIPDSVKVIDTGAFYNCFGLTSVTLGNGVQNIGDSVFFGCNSLSKIKFGNGIQSIGDSAFFGCNGLTEIIIPNSVTNIGEYAFNACKNLASVTIGSSVKSIEMNAFSGCMRLVEVFNKSDLSLTAGSYDNGNVALFAKNIYTQEGGSWLSDTEDGYRFLYDGSTGYLVGYFGTETQLTLPQSFTAYNGTQVMEYEINLYAFYECSGLTSIAIPDSVTSIGGGAFNACSNLTSVTIGSGVTYIGDSAFHDCYSLENVYYHGTEEEWESVSIGYYNSYLTSATIYYYSESDPFEGEGAVTEGNYWRYADDGKTVVVWTKETV